MLLDKSIIKAISPEGISGIYFVINPDEKGKISKHICDVFDLQWKKACAKVEEKYGNCFETENRWPSGIDVYSYADGIFVTFPALYILYDKGRKCDTETAIQALKQMLEQVRTEYRDIKYFGYIGFIDLSNNVFQWEEKSDESIQVDRYPFIADAIERLNENADEFMDVLYDCCYENYDSDGHWIMDVFNTLHLYEDRISSSLYEQILSTTGEFLDDDTYDLLEYMVDDWKNE